MNPIQINRRLIILIGSVVAVCLLAIVLGSPRQATGTEAEITGTSVAHLPIIRHDPTPTPIPTPSLPPSPYEAHLLITPDRGLNASTFDKDSFALRNNSTNGQKIDQVRIDLSTAVFPDMIFDPYGQGGDTLAKDLHVDHGGSAGFDAHRYDDPHGGGFDVLELNFNSFDPGDEFRFSVDVDPNSIRGVGAPGPNESGSVSGIELIGSTVTVTFEDSVSLSHQTFRIPDSYSGSEALLRKALPPPPQVALISAPEPPATVNNADQVTLITGPGIQPVTLLVLEGGLFLEGVPGGGYNVKPFDANNLVAIHEYEAVTGPDGSVEIQVVLNRSMPQAGLNHFTAAFDNYFGMKGLLSEPLVFELLP